METTVDIGNSIGIRFTPVEGDTLTISIWDVVNQMEVDTVGTYDGEAWVWYPEEGDPTWPGEPFIVRPYRDGGMPTATWP